MTVRRKWGDLTDASIDISDLVMRRQDRLLARRYDRIEYLGWILLTTGTFAVSSVNGAVLIPIHIHCRIHGRYRMVNVCDSVPLSNFRDIHIIRPWQGC